MVKLIGSKPLYMWQKDRKIFIEDESVKWVEYAHESDEKALRVEVFEEDEMRIAFIPNIMLQSAEKIRVWFVGAHGNTISGDVLNPIWRNKPSDYVYTETEIKSYESLERRIEALEENGGANVDLSEIEADITELQESVGKLSEDKADKADIPTDEHINELINVALGVVENGTY